MGKHSPPQWNGNRVISKTVVGKLKPPPKRVRTYGSKLDVLIYRSSADEEGFRYIVLTEAEKTRYELIFGAGHKKYPREHKIGSAILAIIDMPDQRIPTGCHKKFSRDLLVKLTWDDHNLSLGFKLKDNPETRAAAATVTAAADVAAAADAATATVTAAADAVTAAADAATAADAVTAAAAADAATAADAVTAAADSATAVASAASCTGVGVFTERVNSYKELSREANKALDDFLKKLGC